MTTKREHFGGRIAVIMAMAGSAIGLGNIWRFPYMVGEYGGAAFILVYILCSFILSFPIFLTEAVIGRRTHSNAIGAMNQLAPRSFWTVLGYLSVITPTIIVSYYSIVGGWSIEYFLKSFSLDFGEFRPSGWTPLLFNTIFLGLSAGIVAFGVKAGIEKFNKISIPLLFVLIVLIMVYALNMPGAEKGVDYLVKPDFSKITGRTFAFALGQSFYAMSLGMGIVITYSSYIHKDENLVASGVGTVLAALMFSVLAHAGRFLSRHSPKQRSRTGLPDPSSRFYRDGCLLSFPCHLCRRPFLLFRDSRCHDFQHFAHRGRCRISG